MTYEAINFGKKFGSFHEQWQPKVIAEMNDYQFKLVKLQGDCHGNSVAIGKVRRSRCVSQSGSNRTPHCHRFRSSWGSRAWR